MYTGGLHSIQEEYGCLDIKLALEMGLGIDSFEFSEAPVLSPF